MIHLRRVAEVDFPTRWAHFRLLGFETVFAQDSSPRKRTETALALVLGDPSAGDAVVRIHSQCTTGDVFHSLRCDCHDQLHLALRVIAQEGSGLLIYEQQEGRGIGLMEKLRAYELQEKGLDTIEANLQLGHPVDRRNYELPVEILRHLNVRSLRLLTNNPEKIGAVLSAGIDIVEQLSADVPINPHNAHYLDTKREKLGHLHGPESKLLVRASVRKSPHAGRVQEEPILCPVQQQPGSAERKFQRDDIELTIPRQLDGAKQARLIL